MTDEEYKQYLKSDKWKAICKKRLEIDNYKCVCCGANGTPENPLEIHHVSYRYIGHEENRIFEDLLTVCHIHHKMIHRLMERKTAPNRNGWKNRTDIPKVHVFNMTGENLQYIEKSEV